eukprot:CAMPEP_0178451142 /NCGR_PEP_ID=MMETSP0689_2-20121128/43514_1 /TAXON_ID=160604 /ORGANISM="Amphidinium massartii, Strain CS-259" /LENGTH=64 /DNA_ID=CAMNT_0020076683 /DNA_START=63 /DNA_END=257 /DNA_ORIENTATION=+
MLMLALTLAPQTPSASKPFATIAVPLAARSTRRNGMPVSFRESEKASSGSAPALKGTRSQADRA